MICSAPKAARARFAIVTVALATAGLLLGCGSSSSRISSTRELALQRAQFVEVASQLRSAEAIIQHDLQAAHKAWPPIAHGLPPVPQANLQASLRAASESANVITEPRFMTNATRLTGPAAGIAGIYENFERLAKQGWLLITAANGTVMSTNRTAASFARENSSLYIDAIYDAHFDLSLLGKSLTKGYHKLGGPPTFGSALTNNAIGALAAFYSIGTVRLAPHPASK